jgi:outer membrane protein assembly factor BamB
VYFASESLFALDATLARQLWEFQPQGDGLASSPSVGPDGTIYVGTYHGKVLAIR